MGKKDRPKAASAAAAAAALHKAGASGGFIGFSSFATSHTDATTQEEANTPKRSKGAALPTIYYGSDNEIALAFKNVAKKDAATRLKTLEEFVVIIKDTESREQATIRDILGPWIYNYERLLLDNKKQVRESATKVSLSLVYRIPRAAAKPIVLKGFLPLLLFAEADPVSDVSSLASEAITTLLQAYDSVQKGQPWERLGARIIASCFERVHSHINLYSQQSTKNKDSQTVQEERQERLQTTGILAIAGIVSRIGAEMPECLVQVESGEVPKSLASWWAHPKTMKLLQSKKDNVRCAVYRCLYTCLERCAWLMFQSAESSAEQLGLDQLREAHRSVQSEWSSEHSATLAGSLLKAVPRMLEQSGKSVVVPMLDCVVLLCKEFPRGFWHVLDPRKAFFPAVWKLLRDGGKGGGRRVYSLLMPLLSMVPQRVWADLGPSALLDRWLGSLWEGRLAPRDQLGPHTLGALVLAQCECVALGFQRLTLFQRSPQRSAGEPDSESAEAVLGRYLVEVVRYVVTNTGILRGDMQQIVATLLRGLALVERDPTRDDPVLLGVTNRQDLWASLEAAFAGFDATKGLLEHMRAVSSPNHALVTATKVLNQMVDAEEELSSSWSALGTSERILSRISTIAAHFVQARLILLSEEPLQNVPPSSTLKLLADLAKTACGSERASVQDVGRAVLVAPVAEQCTSHSSLCTDFIRKCNSQLIPALNTGNVDTSTLNQWMKLLWSLLCSHEEARVDRESLASKELVEEILQCLCTTATGIVSPTPTLIELLKAAHEDSFTQYQQLLLKSSVLLQLTDQLLDPLNIDETNGESEALTSSLEMYAKPHALENRYEALGSLSKLGGLPSEKLKKLTENMESLSQLVISAITGVPLGTENFEFDESLSDAQIWSYVGRFALGVDLVRVAVFETNLPFMTSHSLMSAAAVVLGSFRDPIAETQRVLFQAASARAAAFSDHLHKDATQEVKDSIVKLVDGWASRWIQDPAPTVTSSVFPAPEGRGWATIVRSWVLHPAAAPPAATSVRSHPFWTAIKQGRGDTDQRGLDRLVCSLGELVSLVTVDEPRTPGLDCTAVWLWELVLLLLDSPLQAHARWTGVARKMIAQQAARGSGCLLLQHALVDLAGPWNQRGGGARALEWLAVQLARCSPASQVTDLFREVLDGPGDLLHPAMSGLLVSTPRGAPGLAALLAGRTDELRGAIAAHFPAAQVAAAVQQAQSALFREEVSREAPSTVAAPTPDASEVGPRWPLVKGGEVLHRGSDGWMVGRLESVGGQEPEAAVAVKLLTGREVHTEARRVVPVLATGCAVRYLKRGTEEAGAGTVTGVHLEDLQNGAYYSVRYQDAAGAVREVQTTVEHLRPEAAPAAPPRSLQDPESLEDLHKLLARARQRGDHKESLRLMKLIPLLKPKPVDHEREQAQARARARAEEERADQRVQAAKLAAGARALGWGAERAAVEAPDHLRAGAPAAGRALKDDALVALVPALEAFAALVGPARAVAVPLGPEEREALTSTAVLLSAALPVTALAAGRRLPGDSGALLRRGRVVASQLLQAMLADSGTAKAALESGKDEVSALGGYMQRVTLMGLRETLGEHETAETVGVCTRSLLCLCARASESPQLASNKWWGTDSFFFRTAMECVFDRFMECGGLADSETNLAARLEVLGLAQQLSALLEHCDGEYMLSDKDKFGRLCDCLDTTDTVVSANVYKALLACSESPRFVEVMDPPKGDATDDPEGAKDPPKGDATDDQEVRLGGCRVPQGVRETLDRFGEFFTTSATRATSNGESLALDTEMCQRANAAILAWLVVMREFGMARVVSAIARHELTAYIRESRHGEWVLSLCCLLADVGGGAPPGPAPEAPQLPVFALGSSPCRPLQALAVLGGGLLRHGGFGYLGGYRVAEVDPAQPLDLVPLGKHCLFETVRNMPALVREWWTSLGRSEGQAVTSYVANNVTAELLEEEIGELNAATKAGAWDPEELQVRGSVRGRTVTALYRKEDCVLEMEIQLPAAYPLKLVQVEATKRMGVREDKFRRWVLQIVTLMKTQDGSILDAIHLWKRNVDKEFEGVEPCPICYAVLHPNDQTLPRMSCNTCANKFHARCLVKWFASSHKNECPLCRSQFGVSHK